MYKRKWAKNEIEDVKQNFIYNPETGDIFRRKHKTNKSDKKLCSLSYQGYIRTNFREKAIFGHKIAWIVYYGKLPINLIDHINENKTDNRICNLRDVTNLENCQNKIKPQKNNKSGLRGVHKIIKNKKTNWVANIWINGKSIRIGTFCNPEDAYQAYINKKLKLHTSWCG
jgi:hypothetical protein